MVEEAVHMFNTDMLTLSLVPANSSTKGWRSLRRST